MADTTDIDLGSLTLAIDFEAAQALTLAIDLQGIGPAGPQGDTGEGIPTGGLTGQVLTKASNDDYDSAWVTSPAGVTDHGLLSGLTDADHPITAVIGLQGALDGKSATTHTHIGIYEPAGSVAAHVAAQDPHSIYLTATEGDVRYATFSHNHDTRYYTEAESDARYSQLGHNHDSSYYTESESDARYAALSHDHDTRYFTESESDARYSALGHNHDDRYYTDAESDARYSSLGHNHDDRYYTDAESDAKYALLSHTHDAAYAALTHDHDSRYYTEGEIDTALAGKSPVGHTHTGADLNDIVASGTYTKLTVSAKGLATAGTTLGTSDIPDLSATYLTLAGGTLSGPVATPSTLSFTQDFSYGAILFDTDGLKRISYNDGSIHLGLRNGSANTGSGEKYLVTGTGAAQVALGADALNGSIVLRAAVTGTAGNAVTWDSTLAMTSDPVALVFNSNTVWHAGNDGTGSGLDADKLDGNEATAFVRTNADSTIATNDLSFGSAVRQMLNLYSTTHAIGVQSGTLYARSNASFAVHIGGTHSDTALDPGTGGVNILSAQKTNLRKYHYDALVASVADRSHVTLDTYVTGAYTITRLNYLELSQPVLAAGAAITNACLFSTDAAVGTHKMLDAGSTKTTPGTVNGWIKINVNGTLYYVPMYTSKTT